MAELDELERSLALAQIGLAAPPGVRERVRAKLGAVAVSPVVSPAVAPEVTTSAAAGPRPLLKPDASSSASVVARRGVPTWGALALTGLGFAAGYLFGYRPTPAANEPAMRPSAAHTEPASAALSPRTESLQMAVTGHVETEPNGSRETEPNGSRVKELHTKTRAARRTATPDGLSAELALLQRAERAIRAGNAELALALLDQLDREHPKPQLGQEREAARLLADCERSGQVGFGSAVPGASSERARQYLSVHPASVYSERIRSLCALDTAEASTPPNTAPAAETQPFAPDGAEGSARRGH